MDSKEERRGSGVVLPKRAVLAKSFVGRHSRAISKRGSARICAGKCDIVDLIGIKNTSHPYHQAKTSLKKETRFI